MFPTEMSEMDNLDNPYAHEQFNFVTGPVLVSRNPVTHPGDIRILNACLVP